MYNLLLGGYGSHIIYASFDPVTAKIKVVKEFPTPGAPAWIDPCIPLPSLKTQSGGQTFYTIVELGKGQAVGLELKGQHLNVTGAVDVTGSPCHVHALEDGSGIVIANYMGGNAQLIPTDNSHCLDTSSTLKPLYFPYIYKGITPPNPERQDTSHPHQIIEGPSGELYVPDLGCDRIWVVHRDQSSDSGLKIQGHLQTPKGSGPRHGVVSKNNYLLLSPTENKHLYILGELNQSIFCFPIASKAGATQPQPMFSSSIAPPTVPDRYRRHILAAELVLHPSYTGTLYASNRLELHIKKADPSYSEPETNSEMIKGDAVAIVILDPSGTEIESTSWIRTQCDHIRGLMCSPDGKYVALAGQDAGGVEIWEVQGDRGQDLKLAARNENLKQVSTFVWL